MTKLHIPSRSEVENLCRVDESKNNGVEYSDHIWVKYGMTVTLSEAAMQRYVHKHTDPQIIRVPEAFDAFTTTKPNGASVTYIVMENLKDDDNAVYSKKHPQRAEQALKQIAHTVHHIWELPLPPNVAIGPLGQRRPANRLFSDGGSDRSFGDIMELEDWINTKLEAGSYPDRARLQGERPSMCHCD